MTAPALVDKPELQLETTKWLPKATVTKHWNDDLMTYASVSKGYRGGGFNPPQVPENIRTYKGDSAWAYELGTKYSSADRRLSLAADVFYYDYKDYVGLNSILATGPSFTTIDLNSGDVKSYGVELEASYRPLPQWTISGGGALMHGRRRRRHLGIAGARAQLRPEARRIRQLAWRDHLRHRYPRRGAWRPSGGLGQEVGQARRAALRRGGRGDHRRSGGSVPSHAKRDFLRCRHLHADPGRHSDRPHHLGGVDGAASQ